MVRTVLSADPIIKKTFFFFRSFQHLVGKIGIWSENRRPLFQALFTSVYLGLLKGYGNKN
jgi:hypothetical protein